MNCHVCGKNRARLVRSTQLFGTDKDSYLVENVPVVACDGCGESYVTARTAKELERIHRQRKSLTVKRTLPVARFGGAA
jgi:YgiT-type zinc finger domain-containing protein